MADDMDALAKLPPEIVRNDPRYQQQIYEVSRWLLPDPHGPVPPPQPMPIWHLDGVDWVDAPPPPRRHQHWAQTVGHVFAGETHYRCACGAHGGPLQVWVLLDKPRRL